MEEWLFACRMGGGGRCVCHICSLVLVCSCVTQLATHERSLLHNTNMASRIDQASMRSGNVGLYSVDEATSNLLEENRMHTMDAIRVCPPPVIHAPCGPPRFGASAYVSISPMVTSTTAIKKSSVAQTSSYVAQSLPYSPIAPVGRFLPHHLSPTPTHYDGGSQIRFSWTASNAEIESLLFAEEEEEEEDTLSSSTKSMITSHAPPLMFHPIQLSSYRQVSDYHTPRSQHHSTTTTIRASSGASQSSSRGKDLENMMHVASILTAMPHTPPPPPGKKRNDDDDWVPSGPAHAPPKAKKKSGTKSKPRLELAIPTELDVLSGRGGETNKHEGNLLFRKEARKLRDVYRANGTSREVKYKLSLVRTNSVYTFSRLFYA